MRQKLPAAPGGTDLHPVRRQCADAGLRIPRGTAFPPGVSPLGIRSRRAASGGKRPVNRGVKRSNPESASARRRWSPPGARRGTRSRRAPGHLDSHQRVLRTTTDVAVERLEDAIDAAARRRQGLGRLVAWCVPGLLHELRSRRTHQRGLSSALHVEGSLRAVTAGRSTAPVAERDPLGQMDSTRYARVA